MAWQASTDPVIQQKWRDRLAEFEASDVSLAAFSKMRGVGYSSMGHWRRWLRLNPPLVPALVEVKVAETYVLAVHPLPRPATSDY